MSNPNGYAARKARLLNRVHARLATRARAATGFVSAPEPRTIGSFARGRQLVAGNYLFAGYLVEAPGTSLWALKAPDAAFQCELHGFAWLDDLASVGDITTRETAQAWLWEWIARYGRGKGPGWTPELTGRRLIRWINHALFVMLGRNDADVTGPFYRSLAQQTIFLGRRWGASRPGLARFEALTGLIYAGLSLEGWEVKSLRAGRVQLAEGYVQLHQGEAWLHGAHITALAAASTHVNPVSNRRRKLLLHKREINELVGAIERKGYTAVPLKMFWSRGKAKLAIGVAKGKKQHDKRATERDRDWQRQRQRLLKAS